MESRGAEAWPGTFYEAFHRVADWWTQAILTNPATVARAVRGEKGGAGIEETCLIRPDNLGSAHLAHFPKFESREIRGEQNNLSD